jgi:16S rRNA (cytidine1402-2'-O)-methyltransferase
MLYIVATPIGNIKDISLRAIEVLESAEVVLCEDTRISGGLLDKLAIKNKPQLVSFYDEVEEQKIPLVVEMLRAGKEVALVSDAGTPLISDPGWKLVKRCQHLGLKYTAIPGACAAVNALVLSGLPSGRFCFLGFLPKKSGERSSIIRKYADFDGAKIVYESPFRVEKLLKDIKEVMGDKVEIRVIREMTKMHEEVNNGPGKDHRGEVVVVFE